MVQQEVSPTFKTQRERSKRGTRGNPAEYEGRLHQWDEERPRVSARGHETDVEVEVVLKVMTRVRAATAREMLWKFRRHPKRATPHMRTRQLLTWCVQTCGRHIRPQPENNAGLDTLAEEYEAFEVTMKKVAFEHEEGDMLYAMASEVAEELDRAQKDQDRLHDELEFTCEGIVIASKEFTNCSVRKRKCDEGKTEWSLQGSR